MRIILLILLVFLATPVYADSLPSWSESPVKDAIIEWLTAVTDPAGADFIPVAERIAVFDNDGTSWCERPDFASTGFQVSLARSMADLGKVDGEAMPFKAWFANDRQALREYGYGLAYTEMNESFAGMPVAAYRDSARAWLDRNLQSDFGVPFTDLYYAPMIELKDLLLAHDFQVWVVTGAAQDFVRSYIEEAFGIAPERVIGTWTTPIFEVGADGAGRLVRGPLQTYNGHENKPAHIEQRIGRRPVFSAGNSNNDQPMCRYAVTGEHRGFALWIHHDDSVREYDYDRGTDDISELCETNDSAHEVSIKNDWARIFGSHSETK